MFFANHSSPPLRATFFIFSFLVMALSVQGASAANMPDGTHPWFKPGLTVDNDPGCAAILAAAQARFVTGDRFDHGAGPLPDHFERFTKIDPGAENNPEITYSAEYGIILKERDGRQFQLTHQQMAGCGGCDSGAYEVAPIAPGGTAGHPLGETSNSMNWTIYSTDTGAHFLIGLTDKYFLADTAKPQIEVWHIGAPAWKAACQISVAPNLTNAADPQLQTALAAINALDRTSKGMTRAYGENCGSAHFPAVADSSVQNALQQSLYRPWALDDGLPNEGGRSAPEHFLTFLRQWSLGGLSEQQSYRAYQEQLSKAQTILAGFYESKFGWSKDAALAAAKLAPLWAMAGSYPVSSSYVPPASLALRAAIMAHRPMHEIRALPLEPAGGNDENLLDSAVLYPEALSYLLGKGLNPNEPNLFGKTPLMYAAQYNQLESARVLLDHRADPNARTFEVRQCDIAVKTGNMTALHYAARYSAPDMIRLLLEKGAVPFVHAHNDDWPIDKRAEDQTPGDWLAYYTRGTGEENPLATAADLPALNELLKGWDNARIAAFAKERAARGDQALRQGDAEGAYQALSIAAFANPGNKTAVGDLPLAAFKTGRLAEAAMAATHALETLKAPPAQAAALFNMGLVCEQVKRTNFSIHRGDDQFCAGDNIDQFLNAWKTQPNAVRAAKLVAVMKTPQTTPHYPSGCTIGGFDYRFGFHPPAGEKVYVLHPAGRTIDVNTIRWPGVEERPKLLESFSLGDQALTVIGMSWQTDNPVIGGQVCK